MNPVLLCTLTVYANGACNLHFNNGAEYTGAALRHQTVIQPSRILVANAHHLLPEATLVKKFPLPMGRQHNVYMLTKKGIYKRAIDPMTIRNDSTAAQNIYVLYQRLMRNLYILKLNKRDFRDEKGKKDYYFAYISNILCNVNFQYCMYFI